VENVFGIELEIGSQIVEKVALAAKQHVDLADIGVFRGPRHRRLGVAPAGRAHHAVELRDHLRTAGGVIHDDEPRRRTGQQSVARDQQCLDILGFVDADHDDAAAIPDLLDTAGGRRTK
jgi:hypothetical protein